MVNQLGDTLHQLNKSDLKFQMGEANSVESINMFCNKIEQLNAQPQVLEIIERPQELEDGLIEYQIKSGKRFIALPKYHHGSAGIRFSLTQSTCQEMPEFIWIQGNKMVINVEDEAEVGAFSFNLIAEDPSSGVKHDHIFTLQIYQLTQSLRLRKPLQFAKEVVF